MIVKPTRGAFTLRIFVAILRQHFTMLFDYINMPELPEVENYRYYLESTILGQQISKVQVYDDKVLACPEDRLSQLLENTEVLDTERIGKYLFLSLSSQKVLVLHFGMTGSLEFVAEEAALPRFTRVAFFTGQGVLAYVCPRKFGRLYISDSISAFCKARKLSKDASKLSLKEFSHNLEGRKTAIKTALLNQSIAAGVGNWIADELLFHAQIHPKTRVNTLSEQALERIYHSMQKVIHTAIEHQANYDAFPEDYLIHRRGWTEHSGNTCGKCGSETLYFKVGGRATYSCPKCQPAC